MDPGKIHLKNKTKQNPSVCPEHNWGTYCFMKAESFSHIHPNMYWATVLNVKAGLGQRFLRPNYYKKSPEAVIDSLSEALTVLAQLVWEESRTSEGNLISLGCDCHSLL